MGWASGQPGVNKNRYPAVATISKPPQNCLTRRKNYMKSSVKVWAAALSASPSFTLKVNSSSV